MYVDRLRMFALTVLLSASVGGCSAVEVGQTSKEIVTRIEELMKEPEWNEEELRHLTGQLLGFLHRWDGKAMEAVLDSSLGSLPGIQDLVGLKNDAWLLDVVVFLSEIEQVFRGSFMRHNTFSFDHALEQARDIDYVGECGERFREVYVRWQHYGREIITLHSADLYLRLRMTAAWSAVMLLLGCIAHLEYPLEESFIAQVREDVTTLLGAGARYRLLEASLTKIKTYLRVLGAGGESGEYSEFLTQLDDLFGNIVADAKVAEEMAFIAGLAVERAGVEGCEPPLQKVSSDSTWSASLSSSGVLSRLSYSDEGAFGVIDHTLFDTSPVSSQPSRRVSSAQDLIFSPGGQGDVADLIRLAVEEGDENSQIWELVGKLARQGDSTVQGWLLDGGGSECAITISPEIAFFRAFYEVCAAQSAACEIAPWYFKNGVTRFLRSEMGAQNARRFEEKFTVLCAAARRLGSQPIFFTPHYYRYVMDSLKIAHIFLWAQRNARGTEIPVGLILKEFKIAAEFYDAGIEALGVSKEIDEIRMKCRLIEAERE